MNLRNGKRIGGHGWANGDHGMQAQGISLH